MKHKCPVCGFGLDEPAADFSICPSCGTEFGYHDSSRSHADLRRRWLLNGLQWSSPVIQKPARWNPLQQLLNAGLNYSFSAGNVQRAVEPIILGNLTIEAPDSVDEVEYAEAV